MPNTDFLKEKNKSTQILDTKLLRPYSAERRKAININSNYTLHVNKANSYVVLVNSVQKLFALKENKPSLSHLLVELTLLLVTYGAPLKHPNLQKDFNFFTKQV